MRTPRIPPNPLSYPKLAYPPRLRKLDTYITISICHKFINDYRLYELKFEELILPGHHTDQTSVVGSQVQLQTFVHH
jgi:hypothetical protein